MAESSALMGADYWRYGMSESSHEIEALIGYSYDQGLLPRKPAPEELFHPSTLEVSKI
jgi:4,5-dihydroxyphthalate decarboxylase